MLISGKPLRTSILFRTSSVSPLTRTALRNITPSSQPQRRGRPVVVPNSSHGFSPVPRSRSAIGPSSSVGNGPPPTRVLNAFATPTTRSTYFGPKPSPVSAPPAVGDELVTNG